MGRITGTRGSHGHRIRRIREDEYVISWCVDRKYVGARLRFKRAFSRDTDEKGARVFARRHGIAFPAEES